MEAYIDVQDPICDDLVSVIRQKRDSNDVIDDTCKELNKWALECKATNRQRISIVCVCVS